jgi:anti-sigma regulatory factor (Ser/Thr protein kinase)
MSGGTGAVSAGRGVAPPARTAEHGSGAGTVIQEWPLVSELALAALATAPACARGHIRAVAREWGLAHLADTAELVTSEMVTNAVQASERLRTARTPVVRLWVTSDRESLVLRVWDASPGMPVRQEAGTGDDSGRGLMIIDALSTGWGSYPEAGGKIVWATISHVRGAELA